MSYKSLLETISADKPIFGHKYAILSAPVRHSFIIATIWYLTKSKKIPDIQVLEIGSWYGASALSWGQGLKEFNDSMGTLTCVDGWQSFFDRSLHQENVYVEMEKALVNDVAYNIFLHNISTLPKTITTQHIRSKSDDALPILRHNFFDVVYIDADHTYHPVKKDILNSLDLVKDGGIICGDDLNLQMAQVDQETAHQSKLLDFIKDPKTNRNYHPGVTMAIHEIFGEVSMWGGYWAMQKKGQTWKKIDLSEMPIIYPDHFPEDAIEKAKSHMEDILKSNAICA